MKILRWVLFKIRMQYVLLCAFAMAMDSGDLLNPLESWNPKGNPLGVLWSERAFLLQQNEQNQNESSSTNGYW